MSKKLVVIGLLIFGILFSPTVCFANASFTIGSPNYVLDGQSKAMDIPPFIKNQNTYIPVRNMAEALGVKVEWDEHKNIVNLKKGDKQVQVRIGSNEMIVNGVNNRMDGCPEIVHGRVVLPSRWIAQAFDADARWDKDKRTIYFRNQHHQVQHLPPFPLVAHPPILHVLPVHPFRPVWHPIGFAHNYTVPISYTNTLNRLNDVLSDYFLNAGYSYFGDHGIVTNISLIGSTSDLEYTIRLDFSNADDYCNLTEVSANNIETFLNAVRSRICNEINGTAFYNARITGTLYDNDHSGYYVRDNDRSFSFSW